MDKTGNQNAGPATRKVGEEVFSGTLTQNRLTLGGIETFAAIDEAIL